MNINAMEEFGKNLTNWLGVIIGFLGIIFSFVALAIARKERKKTSGLKSIIEIENTWKEVNHIDCKNLSGPQFRKAFNAIEKVSMLWHEKVIERRLIYEYCWDNFQVLYLEIEGCSNTPPGYDKPCNAFINEKLKSAFSDMKGYKNETF